MKRIFPVGRRVLVRKLPVEETTAGGIVLAKEYVDSQEAKQAYGEVVAIAKEAFIDVYNERQCQVGDQIIFRAYAGVSADSDDSELVLINDQDVLAVWVEE